ncbi:siphovirus Gp157 family protein [uncultured Brachyspira sp.]|uniref:siphovirus Gp157 family protein n=1 Tax=uncultured Brachyspira sp. TaxID=221953 RepID=UPI00261EAF9E|nr:siphovirus Gp157 family protein [uncultured Brachyspira sp.]
MGNKEVIENTISSKHKIKELEDMLEKLNYFISVQDDVEKLEEYNEYKALLAEKIKELSANLKENEAEVKEYLSKLAYTVQRLNNEIEMNREIKREADKRIKNIEKSINFLKSNIIETGKIINLFNDYSSQRLGAFNVRVNSTATVNITDKNLIKDEYQKEIVILEIDRKKIKEALENGKKVEGAELVHNLVILGGKVKNEEVENE